MPVEGDSAGIRAAESQENGQNAEVVPEKGASPALEQQDPKKTARMLKKCRRRELLRH